MTLFVKCIVRTVKDQYADWKFNLNCFTNKSRKYNYPWSDRGFNYSSGNSHDISICIGPVCPGLHRAMWKTHIATLHTIGLHHGWGT